MKFIVMHRTNPKWERGDPPDPELIARVGAMMGELVKSGALRDGAGLRPSSEGVRVRFSDSDRTVTAGPFSGGNELPSGFEIVRATTIEGAVDWAAQQAEILGVVEADIRPVTEAWDIGMAPPPAEITSRRYMVQRKATPATESGAEPTPAQRSALSRLIERTTSGAEVQHLSSVSLAPSRRGRRLVNSRNGITMFDGPFLESKELLSGFVIVDLPSMEDAVRMAERYMSAVDTPELDVRELD